MAVVGRLKDGDLLISGEVKERDPVVTRGLVAHFPLDGKSGTFDNERGIQPISNTLKGVNLLEIMKQNWRNPTSWDMHSGITYIPEMDALRIVNYHNMNLKTPVVIDPTKTYQISVDVMVDSRAGSELTYVGGLSLNKDKVRATRNYDYTVASGYAPPLGQWVTLRLTRTGLAVMTSGTSTSFANIKGWTGDAITAIDKVIKYYHFGGLINYQISGGVTYLRNLKVEIVDPDGSNVKFEDDGISIERAGENHVVDSSKGLDGGNPWGRDTAGVDYSVVKDPRLAKYGEYVVKWSKPDRIGTGNCWINGLNQYTPFLSTTWTFSCYVRRADGKPVTSVGSAYIYTSGSNLVMSNPDIEDCGDGWYRVSKTRTGIDVPRRISLLGFSTLDASTDWYFNGWQVEPTDYPTSYKSRTENTSYLKIPLELKPPYSINVWHKPYATLESVTAQASSPMILQLGGYYSNASISLWNFNKTLAIYAKGDTGTAWSTSGGHYPFTPLTWNNKEHMYTLVMETNRKIRVYMDGVFVGENNSSVDITNIPHIEFGSTYNPCAKYKDLSIYSVRLADEEINKLYKNSFSIGSSGDVVNEFVEGLSASIEKDLHIPLGYESSSIGKEVSPSSEASLIYGNGGVFVGVTPRGDLEYNLHRDYGLDWSKDWSIVFFKKPEGTNTGNLLGYSIDSLGGNSNTVGGGYMWFGKNSGANQLRLSSVATVGNIDPTKYFNKWQMVSVVKRGNLITYTNHSTEMAKFSVSATQVITAPNYYVNQHGYDLKLGGWDNTNACNSWFRDLIVAKRAFTENELDSIFTTQMRSYRDILQIQGELKEGVVLLG